MNMEWSLGDGSKGWKIFVGEMPELTRPPSVVVHLSQSERLLQIKHDLTENHQIFLRHPN